MFASRSTFAAAVYLALTACGGRHEAGDGTGPLAFSFNAMPVHRLLQIVGSPTTRVGSAGQSAAVMLGVSGNGSLKVKELDADTGSFIANDGIDFTLRPTAAAYWSASSTPTLSVSTGAGGEARAL